MMHFPGFRFPQFSKKFQTPLKFFSNVTFPPKISRFSSAKFPMTFLGFYFPLFSLFQYNFTLIFEKNIISPYFRKFSSDFATFTCFLHTLFDPNAFMHHTMHVLNASAYSSPKESAFKFSNCVKMI